MLEQLLSDLEVQVSFAQMVPVSSVQAIRAIGVRLEMYRIEQALTTSLLLKEGHRILVS